MKITSTAACSKRHERRKRQIYLKNVSNPQNDVDDLTTESALKNSKYNINSLIDCYIHNAIASTVEEDDIGIEHDADGKRITGINNTLEGEHASIEIDRTARDLESGSFLNSESKKNTNHDSDVNDSDLDIDKISEVNTESPSESADANELNDFINEHALCSSSNSLGRYGFCSWL